MLFRSAAATPASVTIDTGDATTSAIIRADADTEFTQGLKVTSGAFIKRGAGALFLRQPSGRALGVNAASGAGNACTFDEDGSSLTTGFAGVNVAEGELRVQTSGSITLGGNIRIGLNSGAVGAMATNPTFVAVNSSLTLNSIGPGDASSAVPLFPLIVLTNSTLSVSLSFASRKDDYTTIRAVNSTLGGPICWTRGTCWNRPVGRSP